MKKTILIATLFFVITTVAQNNATSFDWSFNAGGGFNTTKRMHYNSQGDLFSLITSGHQTTYGGTSMVDPGSGSSPGTISFIAKRTQTGTSTVFLQRNTPNTTYATFDDFAIDNQDNIIITGTTFGYNSTVFYDFGNGVTLYGKGNFIAKFNSQGVCQWAKLITYNLTGSLPYSENKPISLGILPNNDIYYANRSTNGNKPFWLIKFNPSGTEVWHKEWILPTSSTVGITSSKNNFFFDNTGKAYFILFNGYGDLVTLDGITLTPPAGSHPTTVSILSINNDGSNGAFATYRGAIGDIAVEKDSGNILLDWGQYNVNPTPFNTVPYNVNSQYAGVVALNSNLNFINCTSEVILNDFESIFPLGNLKFVGNDVLLPNETLTIPNQSFTATHYTPTWKFFDNFSIVKFVAHPNINGMNTFATNTFALFGSKLAVSGRYKLANNPTVNVNGTTLTTCDKDPNFATLYPNWVSLQEDVFISQLTIDQRFLSVNSATKKINVSIYPNPTSNAVNVTMDENLIDASLKIISITGQTVLEKNKLSGTNFDLNVSNLNSGIYIIQISDENKSYLSKFIKE